MIMVIGFEGVYTYRMVIAPRQNSENERYAVLWGAGDILFRLLLQKQRILALGVT